jgi:TonB family protein
LLDRDLGRAAARGAGYKGSLNMTLTQARNLGAAIGCDFLITGDAQLLRRSSSARPVYYEAYASVFIVSCRTGRLAAWERTTAEAATPDDATGALFTKLDERVRTRYHAVISETFEREQQERRAHAVARHDGDEASAAEIIDLESADAGELQGRLREPAPYRRLRPVYPETAAQAEAEATVDAEVEIGTDGEVRRVEIVRWAGFGLDESVVSTIRQLHFRPATLDGTPVAVRVLLRYNFRRPAKENDK